MTALETADGGARWRRLVGLSGAVFLGAVLLVAAWAKAIDPAAFAEQIEAEGLALGIGAGAVALLALALEVGLGTALVLGVRRLVVLVPTAALVGFFLFLTGRSYWRYSQGLIDESEVCGCFGNLVQRTPVEAFWQDMVLLVPALLLCFVGRERSGGPLPRGRLVLALVAAAAGVLLAWQAPRLPLDDLATRLSPGVELADLCAGAPDDPARICLDALLSEAEEGGHLVIVADLEDEAFLAAVEPLNELALSPAAPPLWVLTDADAEAVHRFTWTQGPVFEIREAPRALLRPLYRTLPRAFRVEDGRVTETWAGLPPLAPPAATVGN